MKGKLFEQVMTKCIAIFKLGRQRKLTKLKDLHMVCCCRKTHFITIGELRKPEFENYDVSLAVTTGKHATNE